MLSFRWLLLVVCIPLAPGRAAAQPTAPSSALPVPRWEVTPYVGVAVDSPAGTFLGVIPDRNHLFLGVHASLPLARTPRWTFAYAPEVVPLVVISGNPRLVEISSERSRAVFAGKPGPVAGFGVSPVGAEAQRHLSRRLRAFGALAAGVAWFTRDVPVPFSRKFNYTFEYGGGLIWRRSDRTALRAGYKFHHLSNNYSGFQNPGLDGHVFHLGISFSSPPAEKQRP